MDIIQLGLALAALVGVLVVALAAVVPTILDWPADLR